MIKRETKCIDGALHHHCIMTIFLSNPWKPMAGCVPVLPEPQNCISILIIEKKKGPQPPLQALFISPMNIQEYIVKLKITNKFAQKSPSY